MAKPSFVLVVDDDPNDDAVDGRPSARLSETGTFVDPANGLAISSYGYRIKRSSPSKSGLAPTGHHGPTAKSKSLDEKDGPDLLHSLLEEAAGLSPLTPERSSLVKGLASSARRTVENLSPSEITRFDVIGRGGSGGNVYRCVRKSAPSVCMALKELPIIDANATSRRQIARELLTLHQAQCEAIVVFHGAFFKEGNVCLLMEHMDLGSFEGLLKLGCIPEPVVAYVASRVLLAMSYLKESLKIMHRDIKPGNILLSSRGEVKLCDFSIGGELANSVLHTNVGTQIYMAPERIDAKADEPYSIKSDVWALGLTVLELVCGAFPYKLEAKKPSLFNYIEAIVNQPAPTLPADSSHTAELRAFLAVTLQKNPSARVGELAALLTHEWIKRWAATREETVKAWVAEVLARKPLAPLPTVTAVAGPSEAGAAASSDEGFGDFSFFVMTPPAATATANDV